MRSGRSGRLVLALAGTVALSAATAVGVSAHGTGAARPAAKSSITIAFLHNGPVTDQGWSQSHHEARQAMEKALGGKVKTMFVENVPYGKKAEDLWQQLAARKVDAIVDATAAGPSFAKFCAKHLDLACATTYPPLGPEPKNLTNFYVEHWVGSYLAGVAAGLLSKSGTLGYVAPFKVPTVNAALNSFTLGCQSVKPNCTVKTVLVNSWYDPPKETEAAQTLLNGGADVMYGLTDDPAYGTVAAKASKWSFSSYQYAYKGSGKWWASGITWEWTKMYVDYARGLLAGTWKAHNVVGPSGLSRWGTAVPASVKAAVAKVHKQMAGGRNVFKGPIYDNKGKLRVKAGQSLSPTFLLNGWTWLVKGVVSS
ncbi:MAG TPA: BMP family ABC transporter substrate-binding protein [Gaiellaceae bacterium]|nr:BMP family ABC transporter substrate-binding protein [Gaiellaceae bacterium]